MEQGIGIGQSLVVALELGKVEEGQTVEGSVTRILAQTKLSNFERLVIFPTT